MKYRKKKSSTGTILFAIALGLIVVVAISVWYFFSRYQYFLTLPVSAGNTEEISFVVKGVGDEKPDSANEIAENLAEKNLIVDKDTFTLYVKLNKLDRNLKAGRFLLSKDMTIPEIVEKLSSTTESEIVVRIPEGYTIKQIDKKLADLGIIEKNNFIEATKKFDDYEQYPFLNKEKIKTLTFPLEGFLFPDTYYISPTNFKSEEFIHQILRNFDKKFSQAMKTIPENKKEPFEIITMASIIEKESNKGVERPIIAGILWKRLDEHITLGADATLLYLQDDRVITYQDLQEDSPYNTPLPGFTTRPHRKSRSGKHHCNTQPRRNTVLLLPPPPRHRRSNLQQNKRRTQ